MYMYRIQFRCINFLKCTNPSPGPNGDHLLNGARKDYVALGPVPLLDGPALDHGSAIINRSADTID